jgi:3-phenylpropionate/trans-cinnamate dioxygenase ferredoxin reductase subunit
VTLRKNRGGTQRIQAQHVVIATGAAPQRIPGIHRDVLHLRTAAEARILRDQLRPGVRIAILGAGAIGTELASSAAGAGAHVTLIDPAAQPLQRFLGGHLGDEATAWIRDGGVNLLLNTAAEAVEKTGDGGWIVATGKGDVEADLVVSAIGTRPCVSWLRGSGLDTSDGVRCDRDGTALDSAGTPVTRVHAIGDVAAWPDEGGIPRRHEDWTTAQRQGRHLARTLLGRGAVPPPDRERDYFWTHQFGRRIQILGTPAADGQLVTQMTNPEKKASFHTIEREGQTVAWISVNASRQFALAMRDSVRAAS